MLSFHALSSESSGLQPAVVLACVVAALTLAVVPHAVSGQPLPYSNLERHAFEPDTIRQTLRNVSAYQLELYGPTPPTGNWLVGTFFSGMIAAHHATDDPWFLERARQWGEQSQWDIREPTNADDVCPGQTYLDLYFVEPSDEKIARLVEKLGPLLDRKVLHPGEPHRFHAVERPFEGRHLWWWCDALYMAPPVYARLAKATGDRRYLEQMHELFWDSTAFLYDPDERLFYRDARRFPGEGHKGPKEFWGRGNGWVFAGLARTLPYIPEDDPRRADYLKLFRDMAFRLAELQQPDGMWRAWLNHPNHPDYRTKETSASAFFVYGMAKGINEGWLPRAYFLPAVVRGWTELYGSITPEGKLTHAQRVGAAPQPVRPWDSADYAVGGTLLAGAEVLRLAKTGFVPTNPDTDGFLPRLVAEDGAFTWYNDERAIMVGRVLLVNYVKRDGHTALSTFGDPRRTASPLIRNEVVLSTWAQKDDHNNGALLRLSNNRVLATYGRHGTHPSFSQRVLDFSRAYQPPAVSEERDFSVVTTKRGLTYQNLIRLTAEGDPASGGRIYNFFRGNNFNPAFIVSDDEAETWGEPVQLIRAGTNSNRRPYVKYADNGKDRIDIFYNDGHPRDVKNNHVYHAYYKSGVFYKTDGTPIKSMEELRESPLVPEDGTRLFDGGTDAGRGWVWDLELSSAGNPQAAFISSPSGEIGTDMRYWVATWNEDAWYVEEIGFAGSNLYPKEQHYAGGIALDPFNPDRVVVSADVHPGTGEPLPQRIYQLFKGTRSADSGWAWEQLTFDPVNNQLRPFLLRDRPNTLVWFAGEYNTYTNYRTKILVSLGL
ncbi:MAG: glycoside hydrolase family 88 protein [Planctomycetota bacterium]